MGRIKKKVYAVVAALLAMLTFSACGVDNGGNSSIQEETVMLTITEASNPVVPYIPAVKNYLATGASANVSDYGGAENQYRGVKISWQCNSDKVAYYTVEYATKADYTDALCERVTENTSLELFNLYKATVYYLRVTAYDANGKVLAQEKGQLETTDVGPRFMKVDGIYNVRDLGGYITQDGKRTVQGILYRGGSLTPADIFPHNLTDAGKAYMSDVMGIKTEIDFRSIAEAGGHVVSPIPGANLVYITIGGYADAFGGYAQGYKEFFSALAVKENYPIYMHCTGGADRTGTASFLLNALLGVSELECVQDYELTTFSIYNARNTKRGEYAKYYQGFREKLDTYAGDTLQEKVETYLLEIGLTQTEIDNIQAIMCGEK